MAADAAAAAAAAPRGGAPRRQVPGWLPPLAALLLACAAAACALGALGAADRTATVESWPDTVGVVTDQPRGDGRGPGVVWWDARGRQRVLWLTDNDVDDLPPGSITRVAYDPAGSAAELRAVPRRQRGAYASLGLVSALGALACGVWWRRGGPGGQPSWPRPRRRR